ACSARHPDPLTGIGQDRHVHLRLMDHSCQLAGKLVSQLGRSEPSCLDLPYIWVEQRSVALDQATREIDLLLWTRRDRQLRMVPDGDVEHITRSNAVRIGVVIQQDARDLLRTGAAGMFLRNEARGNRHEIQLVIAGCPDLAWSWLGTGQMLAGGPDTTGKEKGRHQRERAGPVGSIHVA